VTATARWTSASWPATSSPAATCSQSSCACSTASTAISTRCTATPRWLPLIARDLSDLEQTLPLPASTYLDGDLPLPVALGWLYVAEGSNLGGTVLYKMAARLGLDSGFGARHLAAHPDGAARHWREFTAALDGVALTEVQEQQVIDAADAAFRSVHGHVEEEFA